MVRLDSEFVPSEGLEDRVVTTSWRLLRTSPRIYEVGCRMNIIPEAIRTQAI